MPKVSVIVPNYNHAPYLKQRLDSIFNQTFQDFEVIILDDCSTDNSREIIEQYRSNPKVSHIVYNETNSGSPFKQWAKGFDLAQGKYIWIAESDDWAENAFLQKLVEFLDNNPNASLSFCESIWTYHDKNERKALFQTSFTSNGKTFLKNWMIESNSICNASGVLFRKDALKDISTEYQTYKGSGDWQFWLEMCRQGDICYCAEPLNYFRQHNSSTTQKQIASGDAYKEMIRIFRYVKRLNAISWYMKISIPVVFLRFLRKNQNLLETNPKAYEYLVSEWEKEILCIHIAQFIERLGYFVWRTLSLLKCHSTKVGKSKTL